jgi:ribosomal protein S12 methylthiotransferase accessory factor
VDLIFDKYKDDRPVNTINKIRDILGKLGLLTVETVWKNSVDGFYSVTVEVENTCLATNGKGTTCQYALASAYGELMERLQNQATFRLSLDLKDEALKYKGFYYAPDERQLSIEEFLNSEEEWARAQLARVAPGIDKQEVLKEWLGVSYEKVPADFIALPYINLTSKRISHIPMKMISKMYMSNGMCAGNTPQEAIVQGISEILERYANKQMVRAKVVPPTIPRRYLERYPQIMNMIAGIEASGDFEVIVKDCSLGQGFPVVGIVFINKTDQSYFVKFGAHPVFEIAAERTLTELLQGQDIRRMMGVREFSYRIDADTDENMMGILVNGSGVYPSEFFGQNASYQFSEPPQPPITTNKGMLSFLVNFLAQKGFDVYVRDNSYLGFPSYHIIVPGLSEIEEFADLQSIREYSQYNQVKRLIRNMDIIDEAGADTIIEFIEKTTFERDVSVMDFINLPVRGGAFPWYYSNLHLFLTTLYYWRGKTARAYETFNNFVKNVQMTNPSRAVLTYYKCVRDYLGAKVDGLSGKQIMELLSAFYPIEVIKGVQTEFQNPRDILYYLGRLNCWHCDKCQFWGGCLYQPTEKVYFILKEENARAKINQQELAKLI